MILVGKTMFICAIIKSTIHKNISKSEHVGNNIKLLFYHNISLLDTIHCHNKAPNLIPKKQNVSIDHTGKLDNKGKTIIYQLTDSKSLRFGKQHFVP